MATYKEKFTRITVFLAALMISTPAGSQTGTSGSIAQISGKVLVDVTAAAIQSATVTAFRMAPAPAVRVSAATTGGNFSFSGLPSGQYTLCVQEPTKTLFDPCGWADMQTPITVTNGKAVSGLVIRMKKIAPVTVRINDTGSFLARKPGDAAPPHVMVGVFDGHGMFHPAVQSKKDHAGITYALNIPSDFIAKLKVYSAVVKLASSQNAPIAAAGYNQNIVSPSSAVQPLSLTLNVVGRN